MSCSNNHTISAQLNQKDNSQALIIIDIVSPQ